MSISESRNELLPCPCCGGAAKVGMVQDDHNSNYGGWYVECTGCLLATRLMFPVKGEVRGELTEIWNKRANHSERATRMPSVKCGDCGGEGLAAPVCADCGSQNLSLQSAEVDSVALRQAMKEFPSDMQSVGLLVSLKAAIRKYMESMPSASGNIIDDLRALKRSAEDGELYSFADEADRILEKLGEQKRTCPGCSSALPVARCADCPKRATPDSCTDKA